jgi:sugar/nucleoside kinase (ribokinase family)
MVLEALHDVWHQVDALIVLDQVSEENCGVVTGRVRDDLARLGVKEPDKFVLADSREKIMAFDHVSLKPNEREGDRAAHGPAGWNEMLDVHPALVLARRARRPVFYTAGKEGIYLARQGDDRVKSPVRIPAYPVSGAIDPVGAGDSTSAGITCAVAAGASLEEAAAFGCLVASITIQQIGSTGTATPEQVRQRWQEVGGSA